MPKVDYDPQVSEVKSADLEDVQAKIHENLKPGLLGSSGLLAPTLDAPNDKVTFPAIPAGEAVYSDYTMCYELYSTEVVFTSGDSTGTYKLYVDSRYNDVANPYYQAEIKKTTGSVDEDQYIILAEVDWNQGTETLSNLVDKRSGKWGILKIPQEAKEFNVIIDSDPYKGDYPTLAAYIANSPAAGDRVLVKVDEEITGATMVIPANILLKFQKGKKLWCDENLNPVLRFGDGVVTEGDLLLELSHTGTVAVAISFNGDDNHHQNIILKNTSTGTVTDAFKMESGKKGNLVNGEVINSGGGTVTGMFLNSSAATSNDVAIRRSGGIVNYTKRSRIATFNLGDSPAPEAMGGGAIWFEIHSNSTTEVVLDDSIDWRDRYITLAGFGYEDDNSHLPGSALGHTVIAYSEADAGTADAVLSSLVLGFWFTEDGGDGSGTYNRFTVKHENLSQACYLYANMTNGKLCFKFQNSPTEKVNLMMRLEYSPKQNHL